MEFKYEIMKKGINAVFDEKGNTSLALRTVAWNDKDPRLELRKWIIDKDGNEIPNKGFSFLTEEGPHNLALTLIDNNFGNTYHVLSLLKERNDFKEALANVLSPEERQEFNIPDGEATFFDPSEVDDFLE